MLVQQGYRVVGFTLKLWDAEDEELARKVCCTAVMARDAGRVCSMLGIPHYTLDLREQFQTEVIAPFEQEYLSGRTPNPCVACNSKIKWGAMWEKVRALGLERIATGHYARVVEDAHEDCHLLKGVDPAKDQSYFLWEIPRDLLTVTIFPLGELTKPKVRERARRLGLPVAEKEESQEVCFIPRNDYRSWLLNRQGTEVLEALGGDIIDAAGRVIGRHHGYPLFTVGQRRRLGLGGGTPRLFVTRIDPETKRVHLGAPSDMERNSFHIGGINRFQEIAPDGSEHYQVKIRYRDHGTPASTRSDGNGGLLIETERPVSAVTPGQSAVLYRGDELVAGGTILPD